MNSFPPQHEHTHRQEDRGSGGIDLGQDDVTRPDVVFQTDLKTTSRDGNDVLLLRLKTTNILPTKAWHK